MNRVLSLFFLLFLSCAMMGQDHPVTPLCEDSLFIQGDEQGNMYLVWRVGSTIDIADLAAAGGHTIAALQALNPILQFRNVQPCDLILIPFRQDLLQTQPAGQSFPLYYKVRQGETIFGVATRLLHIEVEKLLGMNALQESYLRTGQILFVGWFEKMEPPADVHAKNIIQSGLMKSRDSLALISTLDKHYAKQKGVAWWNKTKPDPNLFALHRTAPVNSLIEIRNPMFGRSVWAKVIGRIPMTYTDDISVVVSQGVASTLGAIDGRFYVEMSYEVR